MTIQRKHSLATSSNSDSNTAVTATFAAMHAPQPSSAMNMLLLSSSDLKQPVPEISVTRKPTSSTRKPISSATDLQSLTPLYERLVGDVVIGAGITAVVSPFLTVVDKALVHRSAGSHTLIGSAVTSLASMARNPIAYLRSPTYAWMWATYAATYSTANALRTVTEHQEYQALKQAPQDQHERVASLQKQQQAATLFVGTTIVNSGASLLKDQAYARLFGNAAAASQAVPRVSYALWMSRDFTVIGSSFILPDYVSSHLQQHFGMTQERAATMAQIGTPMAAQFLAGPLHFVGLDCYNRNMSHLNLSQRVVERARFLMGGFVEVVTARVLRIIPGYSIAGVGNKKLRAMYRENLIQRKIRTLVQQQQTQSVMAAAAPSAATAAAMSSKRTELVALIRAKNADA